MSKDTTEWIHSMLQTISIPSEDIPNIELYMDQITTFMDTRLAESKRYPDDKIITKTMVNNYTKNHLLPPSVKKKYSREHIFLLIMIYHLKNMLSISDIQSLLEPLSEHYFPENKESGLSLKDIYDKILSQTESKHALIEEEIQKDYENSRDSFTDFPLSASEAEYLDDFSFIYGLCYDIYVRKQMIERIIDYHRDHKAPANDKKSKKK
ncbi:MAG: DUF1836 domain-containing protein [Lachnospiraceae bacterium]|nr:DUF1836 domain-containing protein [Lachnospiraceae bacterium]